MRCHLHFVTGRAEERLSFDIQREIAVRLGYTEHPGKKDVERFMKHYFLNAKDVGDLTAILCAALEDSQAKTVPVLVAGDGEASSRASRKRLRRRPNDFIIENNRIRIVNRQRVPARSGQPHPHLRAGAKHNLVLHQTQCGM